MLRSFVLRSLILGKSVGGEVICSIQPDSGEVGGKELKP